MLKRLNNQKSTHGQKIRVKKEKEKEGEAERERERVRLSLSDFGNFPSSSRMSFCYKILLKTRLGKYHDGVMGIIIRSIALSAPC